jgi:outer membrane protein assembly factor BamB
MPSHLALLSRALELLTLAAAPFLPLARPAFAQTSNVLTQHNDNFRTGANLSETILNTATVGSKQFQKLFSLTVDGQISAQPLYLSGVDIPGVGTRNVVYVATMSNKVYAFDADNGTLPPLWQENLGAPAPYYFMPMRYSTLKTILVLNDQTHPPISTEIHLHPAVLSRTGHVWELGIPDSAPPPTAAKFPPGMYNIHPFIGITSTPVIDTARRTIYLTAKILATAGAESTYVYRLYALDVTTGKNRPGSPILITASVPGRAAGSDRVSFDARYHLQRPGLLLSKGTVYLAFGSHQDTKPFHGWILAYDATTLQPKGVFCTTPDGMEGGIWQAGNGPAADDQGNVYVMTGNGTFDGARVGGRNLGSSFIKLSPSLVLLGNFTPQNFEYLNKDDIDLGSAGPMLLPGTNLLVGGGKQSVFYLFDRDSLRGLQVTASPSKPWIRTVQPRQQFQAGASADLPPEINFGGFTYHHIHGSPVFWNGPGGGMIYVWAERDNLRAFRFDLATGLFPSTSPLHKSIMASPAQSMPGGILSLSANGRMGGTGILWASLPLRGDALHAHVPGIPGVFRAFDAGDVRRELWNSHRNPERDSVGTFAKGPPPTVANGKVYLATFSGKLNVYGLAQHAQYISQTGLPATLSPGQKVNVAITYRNAGASHWSAGTNHLLGSQSNQDNITWGLGRVGLPHPVLPYSNVTFNFTVTAPAGEGTYAFQWQMLQENVDWFGELSPKLVKNVVNPACTQIRRELTSAKAELAGLMRQKAALDPKRDGETIREINEQISAVEDQLAELKRRAAGLLCRT